MNVHNVVADYQISMHEYNAFRNFFIHEHINDIMYVCMYILCLCVCTLYVKPIDTGIVY